MMWNSLRLWPAGRYHHLFRHEYTEANAKFAVTIDLDNAELAARCARIAEGKGSANRAKPVI